MSITVQEFRMWLQGVEEMQDPDWSPSPTQWSKIRSKIDDIKYSTDANLGHSGMLTDHPVQATPITSTTQFSEFLIRDSDPLANIPIGMVPEPAGSGMPTMVPSQPPINAPFARGSGNIPVRTPDDTSGQPYRPPFA